MIGAGEIKKLKTNISEYDKIVCALVVKLGI